MADIQKYKKIITTKKFIGGEGHTGLIFNTQIKDTYGIKFNNSRKLNKILKEKKLNDIGIKLHNLKCNEVISEFLQSNDGYYLKNNEFKIVEDFESDDKNEQQFVSLLKGVRINEKENLIPAQIKNTRKLIRSCDEEIKYQNGVIKERKSNILKYEKDIIKSKNDKKKEISISELRNIYNTLIKNKYIKEVFIANREDYGDYFIVKTNELDYICKDGEYKFNQGAFIFYIPINFDRLPLVANYKKQYLKGHLHHCCVASNGGICTGSQFKTQLNEYNKSKDIIGLIYSLIAFLRKPDYANPYVNDEIFEHAQKVTIKPKNIFDYLVKDYWREHEKWDTPLHVKNITEGRQIPNRDSRSLEDYIHESERLSN